MSEEQKVLFIGEGVKNWDQGARIRDPVTLQDDPPLWGRRKIKN